MSVFDTSDELTSFVTPFLEQIVADPDLRPKFVAGDTSFKVQYTGPDALFLLDCTVDPPVVYAGEQADKRESELKLSMSADDGHKFWLGDLNVPMALARRKVKVEGPVGKLLKLLPAITPAFERYQTYATAKGYPAK